MAYDMPLAVTKYNSPCPLSFARISLSYRLASLLRAVGAALLAPTLSSTFFSNVLVPRRQVRQLTMRHRKCSDKDTRKPARPDFV